MSVPILVCECGLRLKAPGATPGRVGRCPSCGGTLTVPAPKKPKPPVVEDDWGEAGYRTEPAVRTKKARPARERKTDRRPVIDRRPMADGFLPPLDEPETWWLPSVVYPLRGAEGVGMVAMLATVFWAFTVLVPEYCLTAMDDAERLGATSMGYFVALISALPAVILSIPTIFYALQYFGRVLVSSAMGETVPPRTPDRNFAGFLNGLSPWFLWLVLGVSVGLLPLVAFGLSRGESFSWRDPIALGLAFMGLPYALMALMLTFLHDDEFAARPTRVLGTLLQLHGSFLAICAIVAAIIGLSLGAFRVSLMLRENHFSLYVAARLACWMLAIWSSIVGMRILGTYYFHRKDKLKWHRERPRWGVAWRL